MDKRVIKSEPIGNGKEIFVSSHHTFGTDAVLLANFANAKSKDKMVDLGTGCGIIPFLVLRENTLNSCFGVDISPEAIDLACRSAKANGFENFSAVCADLKNLKGKVPFGCHTLVTCNPPYKAANSGLKNPDSTIRTARHEIECTLEDVVSVSAKLLQTSGRLCMCQRPERLSELMVLMNKYKVEPKRLRLVAQRKGERPWLFLIEGRRCGNTGLIIEPTLYLEENGKFSQEMMEIYGAYKEGHC